MFRHLFKRPGLFEEVRRAGDEDQFLSASEQIVRRLVHLNHRFIVTPDDQQGRGSDRRQIGLSQVRSSTSSSVKRSRSSVASPSCCKWRATRLLRGMNRPLPLPCAKTTTPCGSTGSPRMPSRVICSFVILMLCSCRDVMAVLVSLRDCRGPDG